MDAASQAGECVVKALTMLLAEHGVSTTERRECQGQSGAGWGRRCGTAMCETLHQHRTVPAPPDRVCIPLRAVTCPECGGDGRTFEANYPDAGYPCEPCGGRGSVLPSLPDGPIHVAEQQWRPLRRRAGRGVQVSPWSAVPMSALMAEGLAERRTLSQWVADRHELWPVIAGFHDSASYPSPPFLMDYSDVLDKRRVWLWRSWSDEHEDYIDVTDEPWAASLQPGDAVAALYDLRRIEPPITEMVCRYCHGQQLYEIDSRTGENREPLDCHCDNQRVEPLSVAPGVVNQVEVP